MLKDSESYKSYKKSPYRSIKHSTYFHVYDELFSKYRGTNFTFIEIGVLNGGSLFMWRDYFGTKARIIGIDLNPAAKRWEANGFEIFIGSQSDPRFWKSLFNKLGTVDVILDDGGHTFENQIVTTECCVPFINEGGVLVIEDTHTSYQSEFGGPSRLSFVSYAKNIIDGVNFRFDEFARSKSYEKNIFSLRFFESFIVFDIRPQLCKIVSEKTDNGGNTVDARDYRYADNLAVEKVDASLRDLKNIPIIGLLGKFVFSIILKSTQKLSNFRRTILMRRFFKY